MKLPARGSCQCGNVQYQIVEDPLITYNCHCRECQKLSTSAFSLSMLLMRSGLEILSGDLQSWERPADSGSTALCWFCPTCGNRIYHENPAAPELIRLKPGTLEDTSELNPVAHLWTCREQPWMKRISELPRMETQPDLAAALEAVRQGKPPF